MAFAKTVTWTTRRKQGRHGGTNGARLAGGTGSTTGAATASGGATTAIRRPTRTRHVGWTARRATSASRQCNSVKLTLLSVCIMAVLPEDIKSLLLVGRAGDVPLAARLSEFAHEADSPSQFAGALEKLDHHTPSGTTDEPSAGTPQFRRIRSASESSGGRPGVVRFSTHVADRSALDQAGG